MEKKLVSAYELKDVPFPDCASRCAIIGYMGVGECESICPFKFQTEEKGEENENFNAKY